MTRDPFLNEYNKMYKPGHVLKTELVDPQVPHVPEIDIHEEARNMILRTLNIMITNVWKQIGGQEGTTMQKSLMGSLDGLIYQRDEFGQSPTFITGARDFMIRFRKEIGSSNLHAVQRIYTSIALLDNHLVAPIIDVDRFHNQVKEASNYHVFHSMERISEANYEAFCKSLIILFEIYKQDNRIPTSFRDNFA